MLPHGWGDLFYRIRYNWRFFFCIFVPILLTPIMTGFGSDLSKSSNVKPAAFTVQKCSGITKVIPDFTDGTSNSTNITDASTTLEPCPALPDNNLRVSPHPQREIEPRKKFKCAFVIVVMAFFFVFETMPMAITALLPLVLFPLLGIQKSCEVSKNYMKESNMIFLGSIVLALSIEYSRLHIRGALKFIEMVGARPERIMLGVMVFTAALSMWLSDTSCTTMILPILMSICSSMFQEEQIDTLNEEEEKAVRESMELGLPVPPTLRHIARDRRQSYVFVNAALSSGTPNIIIRRRSRLSGDFQGTIPGFAGAGAPAQSGVLLRHTPSNASSVNSPKLSHYGRRRNTLAPNDQIGSSTAFYQNNSNLGENIPEGEESEVEHSNPNTITNTNTQSALAGHGHAGFINRGFEEGDNKANDVENRNGRVENNIPHEETNPLADIKLQENIRKMLLLGTAYSANIGGTGSLVGSGPIKVFKELNKPHEDTSGGHYKISFATWMGFTIPPLTLNVFIVWTYLTWRYYGIKNLFKHSSVLGRKREQEKVKKYIADEKTKLGPMGAHEIGVLAVFILNVTLWILRDPQIFPGWSYFFTEYKYGGNSSDPLNNTTAHSTGSSTYEKIDKTGDSTPAMFAVLLLFIIPRRWDFINFKKAFVAPTKYEPLLDWKFVCTNAPWGYILLIGSGYAISDAAEASGLSEYIGNELELLKELPKKVLLLVVMVVTSILTEVVSNTACATLILPILYGVSCKLKYHPAYLSMASAISASYAFMLPISSPPNAIVFATGELTVREMMIHGLILNIVCTIVLYLAYITYGDFMFDFSKPYNIHCGASLRLC